MVLMLDSQEWHPALGFQSNQEPLLLQGRLIGGLFYVQFFLIAFSPCKALGLPQGLVTSKQIDVLGQPSHSNRIQTSRPRWSWACLLSMANRRSPGRQSQG